MQKLIITGASGLIGSHLIPMLVNDWEIHALSRKEPIKTNLPVCYHQIDLTREAVNYSQLPSKIGAVIYLAQSEHFREFPLKAAEIFQVNTVQLLRMLDYAKNAGARTFIFASSGGVYGSSEKGVAEDISIPASGNIGFYLSSKLCSEIIAENYAPFMNIALLRFFFVYGKEQKRSMLIPRLVDNVRNGNPITLQGESGIRINPVHVSDAACAIKKALNLEGCNKINVAGPDILSLREICNIIGDKVGTTPFFKIDTTQEPRNLIGDIENMKKYLCNPIQHFKNAIIDLI